MVKNNGKNIEIKYLKQVIGKKERHANKKHNVNHKLMKT